MTAVSSGGYPASFSVDAPERIARWRPLVQWLLAIPHLLVLQVLDLLAFVATFVAWFAIVFAGKDIEGLQGVRVMRLRYMMRTQAYSAFLVADYPPFTFGTTGADPGDHAPVRTDVEPRLEDRNRLTTFFRIVLVIPHLLVLALLIVGAAVCVVISFFAVLILGRWPGGLRTFVVGVMRWGVRVQAYAYLLTDEYPPFSLD